MSTSKAIGFICALAGVLALTLTIVFMNGERWGLETTPRSIGYEKLLFDDEKLHTIDIQISDEQWADFCEKANDKEYYMVDVLIDNELVEEVGLRTKGNSTLSTAINKKQHRFSFVIEFDHYHSGRNYHGLDKICVNNLIGDSSLIQDYITYHAFNEMGIPTPLTSYSWVSVNSSEHLGIYLNIEAVEDAFLFRNFNSSDDYIKRYKPDTTGNRRVKEGQEAPVRGQDDDVYLRYLGDNPASYPTLFGTGAKSDLSDADKERMIESIRKLNACEDLESALDVEEVIRYWVVQTFVNNSDTMVGNTTAHNYWLLEDRGQLRMITWDNDSTFSGLDGDSDYINLPIDTPIQPSGGFFGMGSGSDNKGDGWKTEIPMLGWIWSDSKYTERYYEVWQELLDTVDWDALIDKAYGVIADYIDLDPTSVTSSSTVQTEMQKLKLYCELRCESIQGQLDGTIPSTAAGQEAEPEKLVDVSELQSIGGRGGMPF